MEVRGLAVVSNKWLVIKMPVRLPATASSLVVVSKGDTLHEWIVFLVFLGKSVRINSEEGLSLRESHWVGLL